MPLKFVTETPDSLACAVLKFLLKTPDEWVKETKQPHKKLRYRPIWGYIYRYTPVATPLSTTSSLLPPWHRKMSLWHTMIWMGYFSVPGCSCAENLNFTRSRRRRHSLCAIFHANFRYIRMMNIATRETYSLIAATRFYQPSGIVFVSRTPGTQFRGNFSAC